MPVVEAFMLQDIVKDRNKTNISTNQSNFHKQSLKVVYSAGNDKSLTRNDSFVVKMFDRNALTYIIQH